MPTRGTIELGYKFFDKFEREQLAFLYQEETKSGDDSRFSKLTNRDNAAKPKERKEEQ